MKHTTTLIVRKAPVVLFALSIVAMMVGFYEASESIWFGTGAHWFYYIFIVVPILGLGVIFYIASLQLSSTTSKEKLMGLAMLGFCIGLSVFAILS